MCGRFSLFAPRNDVAERFGATFVDGYQPRYNAAPGQELAVLPDATPTEFHDVEWGLVPTWADDAADGGHVNARAETAAEKPSFEDAFRGAAANRSPERGVEALDEDPGGWTVARAGRCLVPADGFYEWGDVDDGRRPHRLELEDGDLFAMAGLWTRWTPSHRQTGLGEFGGDVGEPASRYSFTILTTEARGPVDRIHDRMPAILEPGKESTWLEASADRARETLTPYDGPLQMYPLSDGVNDPANDTAAVVEPLEGDA